MADGAGATGGATVTVTVAGVNDAPVAVDDEASTDEDTALNAAAPGVLGNDTDRDAGDTKTVTAVNGSGPAVGAEITLPSGARLTLRADGSYSYDPSGAFDFLRDGETATDAVPYVMTDGQGVTSTATLIIIVRGRNNSPVAGDDTGATDEDSVLTVPAPGYSGTTPTSTTAPL